VRDYENIIVIRTFSKAYGLASFRVGYAISSKCSASILEKARLPYNVSGFSQMVALAAVGDQDHIRSVRAVNSSERVRVSKELGRLGIYVFDSAANFVLMDCGTDAGKVFERLKEMNIFTRKIELPGYEGCIRVTVRTAPENDTFLSCMVRILGDGA
jgi:histidinol-phosphate aminotransferase